MNSVTEFYPITLLLQLVSEPKTAVFLAKPT